MKSLFEFEDYRKYLSDYLRRLPNKGHGYLKKIAGTLKVHPSLLTQILKGNKNFTPEQALSLAGFLGMNEVEEDYFLELVNLERSGTAALRTKIRNRLQKLRVRAAKVKERLPEVRELSDADKAVFYSNWYYSAIRLLSSIPEYQAIEKMVNSIPIPRERVMATTQFLLETGLCTRSSSEQIIMGPARTYVPADSPLVSRHHSNWRLRAIERSPGIGEKELMLTSPMTVSKKDAARIREMLLQTFQSIGKILDDTEPEQLACLNIDWFYPV